MVKKDDKEIPKTSAAQKFGEEREYHDSAFGVGWGRIWKYFEPKAIGVMMPLIAGIASLSWPVLGMIISKVQFIIIEIAYALKVPKVLSEAKHSRDKWFLCFVFLCIAIGIVIYIEKLVYGISGENLTARVRKLLFRGIIFKQVSWFDDEKKAPGVLTTVLSEDVASLNGMTTETLSTVLEAILGLVLGVLLSAYFCWPMSLMTIGCIPVMIVGVIAMSKLQWKKTNAGGGMDEMGSGDPYLKSNALLSDVILNYRTVISFGEKNVNSVISKYESLLVEPA
jgi:ABC-type multidrug transport system fused ATPase/permease subunit